jgi:hypothetical protein
MKKICQEINKCYDCISFYCDEEMYFCKLAKRYFDFEKILPLKIPKWCPLPDALKEEK